MNVSLGRFGGLFIRSGSNAFFRAEISSFFSGQYGLSQQPTTR